MNMFRAVCVGLFFVMMVIPSVVEHSSRPTYGEWRPFSPPPEWKEFKKSDHERLEELKDIISAYEKNLEARAQLGDIEAILELGERLECLGRHEEALAYYLKGVDAGSDLVMFRLAWLIEWGQIKTTDAAPSSYFISYLFNVLSAKRGNSWAFWSAQRQKLFLTATELGKVEEEIQWAELRIAESRNPERSKGTPGGK